MVGVMTLEVPIPSPDPPPPTLHPASDNKFNAMVVCSSSCVRKLKRNTEHTLQRKANIFKGMWRGSIQGNSFRSIVIPENRANWRLLWAQQYSLELHSCRCIYTSGALWASEELCFVGLVITLSKGLGLWWWLWTVIRVEEGKEFVAWVGARK
jgi:hypothetical protein